MSRKDAVCFTGHRSQKLPWGSNVEDPRYLKTKEMTREAIELEIMRGKSFFISGMALGFDTMCAEIVLSLKDKYPHIRLECALPCKDQEKMWDVQDRYIYHKILEQADVVSYLQADYTKYCLQKRNEYMVDKCNVVIALFGGRLGGTKNTIDYAYKKLKEVRIIPVIDKL